MSVAARRARSTIAVALAALCVSGCFSLSGPTPNRPRYDYSQPVPQPDSKDRPASGSASQPRSGSTAPVQAPSTAH